jgi:hypothetical protein
LSQGQYLIAKWAKAGLFEGVTIEHVVCVEWDEAFTVRVGNVNAGLLDRAEIEGLGVNELDDKKDEERMATLTSPDETDELPC